MSLPSESGRREADVRTTAYPDGRDGGSASPKPAGETPPLPPRCRIAVPSTEGRGFHGELEGLLHSRLRLAVAIALVPAILYLIWNLIEPLRLIRTGRTGFFFHAGMILTTAILGAILWTRPCLSLRTLRVIELLLFGVAAAFFTWLQYEAFAQNRIFEAVGLGHEPDLVRLVAVSSTMRWFFLIVVYGVLIPNTWRRCALIVATATATPLIVTLIGAARSGHLVGFGMLDATIDMAIALVTGSAIAVFGSYRLHHLEERAFEARQLGQYRLKRLLGAGGMGEVYLAEHVLLRRPCAIKLIRPDQAGDRTSLQRFEREVQAMATLTHWNTVEVFDYGHAEDGTFYYVMEYLPGPSLEALVARHGPLPPGRAIHFLRQICRALREAHAVGLLHRDVKPSNVIICERGKVHDVAKLLDFGLVQESGLTRATNRLTTRGTIVGSPLYMSPEQAAGKALDGRSDVYGVGAVAYYLLTAQPPFVRETAMQVLLAHAHEPVVPLRTLRPEVPADLEAVVLRCLEKEPSRRYPDTDSLEKALAACAAVGPWSEEDAAAWWKDRPVEAETATDYFAIAPTLKVGP